LHRWVTSSISTSGNLPLDKNLFLSKYFVKEEPSDSETLIVDKTPILYFKCKNQYQFNLNELQAKMLYQLDGTVKYYLKIEILLYDLIII